MEDHRDQPVAVYEFRKMKYMSLPSEGKILLYKKQMCFSCIDVLNGFIISPADLCF